MSGSRRRRRGGVLVGTLFYGLLLSCGSGDAVREPAVVASPTAAQPTETATPAAVVATPVQAPEPESIDTRVEHRFEISQPDYLAVAAGSVWVNTDNGVVHRINPKTNEVIAKIRVHLAGGDNLCQGIGASDDGGVWTCAGPDAMVQIDPATNKIGHTVELTKSSSQGNIAVLDGHAWVLSDGGLVLSAINTDSGEIDAEIDLGARCTELGVGEQELWITCQTEATVLRMDLASQEVTARIGGLPSVRHIGVAEAVWVGYAGGLARIDLATAEVVGAVEVNVGEAGIVFADESGIWVRSEGLFLQHVDPETMEVTDVLSAPEQSGGAVVRAFGSLWASAYNDAVLYRLRP